jgi:pimeloyl-ACP methyl ester carboxylesterase
VEKGKGISPLLIALTPPGQSPPNEEQLKFANQMLLLTNDQKALAALIRGMPAFAIPRESLEKNKVPVLALIGDRDPFKKGVDAMNGVMSHLKVVVIPGADHMQTFYSPLFATSLREFLEAHRLQPVSVKAD